MARPTSQKTVVSRLFSASERPIYMLDSGGRIVYSNKALAEWLEVDEDRLPGMKCIWAGKDPENMLNRLAIPPQAKNLPVYHATVTIGSGEKESNRAAIFMALNDHAELGTTLVILEEVESVATEESPFDADSLHRTLTLLRQSWSEPYSLDQIIGESTAIRQVRSQIQLAAESQARVVIVGNEGTGRETIARTIHRERTQGLASLVPITCSVMDAELLQTTLTDFALHATNSEQQAPTLLLIEVSELPPDAQAMLLERLNAPTAHWQAIATCREPLSELVAKNQFLAGLSHLLSDIEIRLPSLSDRLDDIPLLAQWTLETSEYADRRGGFDAEAMEALLRYPWPREVSELKEVVEQAAAVASNPLITQQDLPKKFEFATDANVLPDVKDEQVNLDEFMANVESELIRRALKQAKGNRAQAARLLEISRGKLLRRIDQLGIEEE